MKINEIQDLIKFVSKSGVSEVELETKEIKIIIKTNKSSVHVQSAPIANPVVQLPINTINIEKPKITTPIESEDSKLLIIKAPMIGTFYRSAGPDKPPFISIGDEIIPGKPVCIIEAMKLFNEIESDFKGKIVKILVNDSTPVEYDQPLFLVDPS